MALAPQREALPRNYLRSKTPLFAMSFGRCEWVAEQLMLGVVLFQAIRCAIKFTGESSNLTKKQTVEYAEDYSWVMSDEMDHPDGGFTFEYIIRALHLEGSKATIRRIVDRKDPRYKEIMANKARSPYVTGW